MNMFKFHMHNRTCDASTLERKMTIAISLPKARVMILFQFYGFSLDSSERNTIYGLLAFRSTKIIRSKRMKLYSIQINFFGVSKIDNIYRFVQYFFQTFDWGNNWCKICSHCFFYRILFHVLRKLRFSARIFPLIHKWIGQYEFKWVRK